VAPHDTADDLAIEPAAHLGGVGVDGRRGRLRGAAAAEAADAPPVTRAVRVLRCCAIAGGAEIVEGARRHASGRASYAIGRRPGTGQRLVINGECYFFLWQAIDSRLPHVGRRESRPGRLRRARGSPAGATKSVYDIETGLPVSPQGQGVQSQRLKCYAAMTEGHSNFPHAGGSPIDLSLPLGRVLSLRSSPVSQR
jgi:hypothetical protein